MEVSWPVAVGLPMVVAPCPVPQYCAPRALSPGGSWASWLMSVIDEVSFESMGKGTVMVSKIAYFYIFVKRYDRFFVYTKPSAGWRRVVRVGIGWVLLETAANQESQVAASK